jgi:hypothetical protein
VENVHGVYMEGGLPEDHVSGELDRLCSAHSLTPSVVISLAASSCKGAESTLASLLLYSAVEDAEKVEAIIRDNAQSAVLAVQTELFGKPSKEEEWKALALQMELFLFHTRSHDPLPPSLSSVATLSVRLFLLLAFYPCKDWYGLDLLLTKKVDCAGDEDEAERESARSSFALHMITSDGQDDFKSSDSVEEKLGRGGGWQFLQDVDREEAEQLLVECEHIGSWLIRPNREDPDVFSLSFLSESGPQHAVIRLEQGGFRCGSYGPFPKLWGVLEKISSLLPTPLDFDQSDFDLTESRNSVNKGWNQPSPSAGLFRGLGMRNGHTGVVNLGVHTPEAGKAPSISATESMSQSFDNLDNVHTVMLDYLIIQRLAVQVFSIHLADSVPTSYYNPSMDDSSGYSTPTSWLNPLRRALVEAECRVRTELSFGGNAELTLKARGVSIGPAGSIEDEDGYEVEVSRTSPRGDVVAPTWERGDDLIGKMMERRKGGNAVAFRPYKAAGEGVKGNVIVVLFSEKDGAEWLIKEGREEWWPSKTVEPTTKDAVVHLRLLASRRVTEEVGPKSESFPVSLTLMSDKGEDVFSSWLGAGGEEEAVRYRVVDPWEVSGFTSSKLVPGYLGRNHYDSLTSQTTYGRFGQAGLGNRVEEDIRLRWGVGGARVWTCLNGNDRLESSIKSLSSGGLASTDKDGYLSSISTHVYRNTVFSLISSATRFIAVVQVSLLDFKNLGPSPPSGSLTVYSIIRLRRRGSRAPMNNRGRSRDAVVTDPVKVGGGGGWGTSANFRFPLPEGTSERTLTSFSGSTEGLFKGPPTTLCMNVYEKRSILGDCLIGNAEVKLEGNLRGGGEQWENWEAVGKEGWFAKIRVGLRFEVMRITG